MTHSSGPIQPVSIQEGVINFISAVTSLFQSAAILGAPMDNAAEAVHGVLDPYDDGMRCWKGADGLTYRVPLVTIPSEYHARCKIRNIRIMMENVRLLCEDDLLPATASEKQFWSSYPSLKYRLFIEPFLGTLPVVYFAHRYSRSRLPILFRSRFTPFAISGIIAEQLMDVSYPAQQLLATVLQARTPLGDAARAEWNRLQFVSITPSTYMTYQWHNLIGDPIEGWQFGADVLKAAS